MLFKLYLCTPLRRRLITGNFPVCSAGVARLTQLLRPLGQGQALERLAHSWSGWPQLEQLAQCPGLVAQPALPQVCRVLRSLTVALASAALLCANSWWQ